MISNPVIRSLRKQLTAVRARVMGTDESRIAIRAQVWGMILRFNPPTLWATINLADTGDPIAQVLAGTDIDLDRFVATAGPDSDKRSRTIANDPNCLELRWAREGTSIVGKGSSGMFNGYIGTVEAQARGTLHLHILFWIHGAPVASVMRDALRAEAFREKMKQFIAQNIRAHIAGTNANTLMELPVRRNIAYCRPEDPRKPDYERGAAAAEARIARAYQTHDCKPHTCLKMKKGHLVWSGDDCVAEAVEDEEERARMTRRARRTGGRPPSQRVPYRNGARPTRCRVIRSAKQEVNLHFIGRWFARAEEGTMEYYSAQMLLLLKPWRHLRELAGPHLTFQAAFCAFEKQRSTSASCTTSDTSMSVRTVPRNAREEEAVAAQSGQGSGETATTTRADADAPMPPARDPTEEEIARAREERHAARDRTYGEGALFVAREQGIFADEYELPGSVPFAEQATPGEDGSVSGVGADGGEFRSWPGTRRGSGGRWGGGSGA
ncbi:ATP-dependent DNA helicase [Mycena chlorophos]|uniref:ATP-dependent DNA helicase n=1 Tax=Mycena chlorophos TaxID=658473 RepID=A0A8H6S3E9_MYCCL|nr:ATP-dependent DNA helicase [Mycena chlorophos]